MEIPQPPPEQELKNIIDKLAQFVARNGPEFEQMTKQKQKDNPKFSFLFGGEFFNYYQYRVTTEQAILRQKQRTPGDQQAIVQHVVNQQSIQSAPWQQQQQQQQHLTQPPLAPDMHEQIRQSEQNLAAQHQLLMQQQQVQIDEALRKAMDDKITGMATECGLSLEDLDNILQPIIDNCTKDSISTGKGWIFANAVSGKACEVTTQHILRKVTAPGVTFETKLHLVYLINDVLHHCMRKNADDLKKTLDRIVVPMFCSTSIGADPDQQQKLLKLFNLWETNKYFSQQILDQLQNPVSSLAAYQTSLISEFSSVITPITTAIQNQYAMLQKQHRDFVAHLTNQMHHFQHIPYAYQSPQNPPVMAVHPAATLPYSVLPQPPHVVPQQPLHPLDPQQLQRPPPQLPQQITQQQPPLQQMQPQQPPQQFQQQMPQIQQQPPPVDVHQPPPNQQVQQQQQFNQDQNQQLQPEAKPQVQQENHQQEQEQLQNVPSSSSSSDDSGQQQQTKQQAEAAQSDDNSNPPSSEAHTQVQSTPSDSPLPPSSSSSLSTASSSSSSDQSTNVSVPQISVPSSNYNVANISHPASHYGNIPEDCRQGHPPSGPPPPHYRDDFPPRYGQPPPPRMGYVDGPDYRMTPPHMASYNGPPPPPLFGPPPPRGMPMRLNHHDGMPHRPMPPEYMEPMLPPTPPYYDLPAGLMVPLVKLEDTDYGMPLDPKDIRLPPPSLPTDRLLAAVELFYSPPSHDRARNSEGWEQLGLYEYFKAKSQAKKQKQNENSGSGEDSQESITSRVSGTDGTVEQSSKKESENQPPRRRYREFKSPDKEQADTEQSGRNESHRKSHSRSRSRSRSRSPARRRSPSRRSYSRRSRSRSPSPSSRKRSPERSPTPPSFFAGAYPVNPLDRRLDESNKGHQLLKKMGWSGSGLGATEQGIQDPVDAGEVRDRQDMYKGIGINLNDPYENFRKCKGQAFINRMKARAEELEDRF